MCQSTSNPFVGARYGVFFHYLYDSNEKCNLSVLLQSVLETGADYLFFTLGQNSGHYNAPNPVYDHYAGCRPGERCAQRDLPMELADALKPYGIPLMLYLPSNAPARDRKAACGLYGEEPVKAGGDWKINDIYPQRWSHVIGYWAEHYGAKVSAWWFDGFYQHSGFREEHGELYYSAVKRGNPDAMVALNPGVDPVVRRANRFCDFTAGEDNAFVQLPKERYLDGAQWQILSFLGNTWGGTGLKYPAGYLTDYIRRVSERGGVVTVDMHIREDGSLDPCQLKEMAAVRAALYGGKRSEKIESRPSSLN